MIYVNNENKINEINKKISKNNMCVFMDYDKTITSGDSEDSWAAIANKKIMGKSLSDGLDKYYEKYGSIELDYNIDFKEKEKYMIEWYQKCMDLYYDNKLTKVKLEESIRNSKLILRKGAKDILFKLNKNNIPVIILSAGIGNSIEQFLEKEDCYYKNIEIISNFIKFDKNGNMKKFSDYMIHTLNKNIDKLANIEIKEKIEQKEYKIVIGDLIEDIDMVGKYTDEKTLKIGFLNEKNEENIDIYKKNFDIVLTQENNFYDIERYINIFK